MELAGKEERMLDSWSRGESIAGRGHGALRSRRWGSAWAWGVVSHSLWPEQATLNMGEI